VSIVTIDPVELQPFLDQLALDGPVDPFLVLADWLQDRGHPWGELIAVACQDTGDADAKKTFGVLTHNLLEQLADRLCPRDRAVGIAWRRGFVSTIAFSDGGTPDWLGHELRRLLALPVTALCTEVSFAGADLGDDHVRALLGVRPRLARLARLDLQRNWFSPAVTRGLAEAFPNVYLGEQRRGPDDGLDEPGAFVRSWRDD
jgi:hypothetical protein